jgi:hypothetical protein
MEHHRKAMKGAKDALRRILHFCIKKALCCLKQFNKNESFVKRHRSVLVRST